MDHTIADMRRQMNALGLDPDQDDTMERVLCEDKGKTGHSMCGWCKEHARPVFTCFGLHINQADKEGGEPCR